MEHENRKERYDRQIRLPGIGKAGQEKLEQARVLIVGVGGLGCPAAQYLAAAGVGTLGLLDHDTVDLTNLHRQILFTEKDTGMPKAEAAAVALGRLNSRIRLLPINEPLTAGNACELFRSYDLIIDGTDNFPAKYLINDACLLTDKPWVFASVYRYQGQLSVFNYRGGPSYRCLFPQADARQPNCEETGVLGVLPGTLGTLQAAEALKLILGIGRPLSGRMKMLDLLTGEEQTIRFARDEQAVARVLREGIREVKLHCSLREADRFYLDVREPTELPRPGGAQVLSIPLSHLAERHGEIPRDRPVFVYCQSGKRSGQAVRLLRSEYGFTNLENVAGGLQSIIE